MRSQWRLGCYIMTITTLNMCHSKVIEILIIYKMQHYHINLTFNTCIYQFSYRIFNPFWGLPTSFPTFHLLYLVISQVYYVMICHFLRSICGDQLHSDFYMWLSATFWWLCIMICQCLRVTCGIQLWWLVHFMVTCD